MFVAQYGLFLSLDCLLLNPSLSLWDRPLQGVSNLGRQLLVCVPLF